MSLGWMFVILWCCFAMIGSGIIIRWMNQPKDELDDILEQLMEGGDDNGN